ncbi:MAG: hypothetical protein AAFY41_03470 [Bacteroidota bacterium]
MDLVSENDRYSLKCDNNRNRLFITIKGLWKSKDSYLKDLEAACKKMTPGFTIHVDLTTMKPPGQEIGGVHEEAQRILLKYGLSNTAEVQTDRALLRLALERYSDNSGMRKRVFFSHEEAEEWLDAQ